MSDSQTTYIATPSAMAVILDDASHLVARTFGLQIAMLSTSKETMWSSLDKARSDAATAASRQTGTAWPVALYNDPHKDGFAGSPAAIKFAARHSDEIQQYVILVSEPEDVCTIDLAARAQVETVNVEQLISRAGNAGSATDLAYVDA